MNNNEKYVIEEDGFGITRKNGNNEPVKKKFNVAFDIHGYACVIVNAENEDEAKRLAIEQVDGTIGSNGYSWLWDCEKVAVSSENLSEPYELEGNGKIESVTTLSDKWKIV